MDAAAPLPFAIDTEGIGGTVIIDGRDLTGDVLAAQVTVAHGQASRVSLQMRPGAGVIHGAAVIEQVVDVAAPASDVIRALDPHQVREAVEAAGLSITDDPYAATIAAVADLIDQAGAP